MMSILLILIALPFIAGMGLFPVPDRMIRVKGICTLLLSGFSMALAINLLSFDNSLIAPSFEVKGYAETQVINSILANINSFSVFRIDNLSKLMVIGICFFTCIVSIYSLSEIKGNHIIRHFYPYVLITLGAANGAVLCDHLLFFIFFWGILGISLYKLIRGYDEESAAAAKKTLILIGASDSLMILGIAIIWKLSHVLTMSGNHLTTGSALPVIAFLCLLIGSFTKAGAFPFHTWIPDFTEKAPAVSSAYMPASLDKLLGIYFMSRVCLDMFTLNQWLRCIILLTGSLTILTAVMMALVQHNYKRLLGYHAVSQVGYMVLGLGIGTPIAIAGGLFHMINHSLYKSGLFLVAGNVDRQSGMEDIESLGGLSRLMPITFACAMVFSLSISGVPPLNGFASKWLIYQGIIDFGKGVGIGNSLWLLWLGLAVLGSALTLASFIKFLSGIFLGRSKAELKGVKEVSIFNWLPVAVLALICIFAGVFANGIVIPRLIMPLYATFKYPGIWNSSSVGLLFVVSIFLGCLFYLAGNIKHFRTDDSFIGGEINRDERTVNVLDFYSTISHARGLKGIYNYAERKWFDIYELFKDLTFGISHILSKCHTGVLPLYTIWMVAGLVLLLIILR